MILRPRTTYESRVSYPIHVVYLVERGLWGIEGGSAAETIRTDHAESVIEGHEDDVFLEQEVGPEEQVVFETAGETTAVEPHHHGFTSLFIQQLGVNVKIEAIFVADHLLLQHREERTGRAMESRVIRALPGIGWLRHLGNHHEEHLQSCIRPALLRSSPSEQTEHRNARRLTYLEFIATEIGLRVGYPSKAEVRLVLKNSGELEALEESLGNLQFYVLVGSGPRDRERAREREPDEAHFSLLRPHRRPCPSFIASTRR